LTLFFAAMTFNLAMVNQNILLFKIVENKFRYYEADQIIQMLLNFICKKLCDLR